MMIELNSVIIDIDLDARGSKDIYQNLLMLYTTPVGTIPFAREFGLDIDVLDHPIQIAKGKLMVEIIEKTRRFEPRANVEEVNFLRSEESWKLIPKVVIG